MGEILVFSDRIFSGSSWPLIIFNTVFLKNQGDVGDPEQSSKLKIGQDLLQL